MSDTSSPIFVVILLMAQRPTAGGAPKEYEERFFLVQAADEDDAVRKARAQTEPALRFLDEEGEEMEWAFLDVVEVGPALGWKGDGTMELYARTFRDIAAYEQAWGSSSEN